MVSDSKAGKKVRAEREREVDYSAACVCVCAFLVVFAEVHTCTFLCTAGGAEL